VPPTKTILIHARVSMEDAADNPFLGQHVVISRTVRRSLALTPKNQRAL